MIKLLTAAILAIAIASPAIAQDQGRKPTLEELGAIAHFFVEHSGFVVNKDAGIVKHCLLPGYCAPLPPAVIVAILEMYALGDAPPAQMTEDEKKARADRLRLEIAAAKAREKAIQEKIDAVIAERDALIRKRDEVQAKIDAQQEKDDSI